MNNLLWYQGEATHGEDLLYADGACLSGEAAQAAFDYLTDERVWNKTTRLTVIGDTSQGLKIYYSPDKGALVHSKLSDRDSVGRVIPFMFCRKDDCGGNEFCESLISTTNHLGLHVKNSDLRAIRMSLVVKRNKKLIVAIFILLIIVLCLIVKN